MPTRFQGTPKEVASLNAWITLARATQSVDAVLHRHLAEAGCTTTQFGVLEALLHLGPLPQCEVARKLLTSPGNVVMVVDNLERRGLVRRERRADDRRSVSVTLTEDGRLFIERLFPQHADGVVEAFSVLTLNELETLRQVCRKLGLGQDGGASKEPRTGHPVPKE